MTGGAPALDVSSARRVVLRGFGLAAVVSVSLWTGGCSKALTDSSATGVIQKWIDSQDGGVVTIPAGSLTGQIGTEMPQHWTAPGALRLLKEGYLQERTAPVTYPNLSGSFSGRRGFKPGEIYGGWNDTLILNTSSGRPPSFSGFFHTCYTYDPKGFFNPKDNCWGGQVNGTLQKNGAGVSYATLRVTQYSPYVGMLPNTAFPFNILLARGNPDVIRGSMATDALEMQGHASGPDIQQDVYVYSWTPKLPKDVVSGTGLKLGHLIVDKCDHLLLRSETAATASCKVHPKVGDAAAAIFGSGATDGMLQASFGKQPDGAWIGTGIVYSAPQDNLYGN